MLQVERFRFDKVECCFDIVAIFNNNVAGFGNSVERNFVFRQSRNKIIEHAKFGSTSSKGQNFVRHCCQKRQQCRSNIRLCRKDEILL